MDVLTKYKEMRHLIKDGDLVVFRGTKPLAWIIQHCDREPDGTPAHFNHIGIVLASHGSLFIVDSQASGVVSDRLSKRMADYKNGDFAIIQPWGEDSGDEHEIDRMLSRQDMRDVLYDYGNGIKELLNRRFGWNLKIRANDRKDICSDFVYEYACKRKMIVPFKNRVAFPMDYIRYRDRERTILYGYKAGE